MSKPIVVGGPSFYTSETTTRTARYVARLFTAMEPPPVWASQGFLGEQWRVFPKQLVREVVGGAVISGMEGPTFKLVVPEPVRSLLFTVEREWPEVAQLARRLGRNEPLSHLDELCLEELAQASGWDREDVVEELLKLDADPSERAERYEELVEKYYREALEFKERSDTRQAAEKIWGAITALVKLYAALKGVAIMHWSRGKMEKFISNNVEPQHRKLFRDLLDKGHTLHEHFYEGHLDEVTFRERWSELVGLLEKARELLPKQAPASST